MCIICCVPEDVEYTLLMAKETTLNELGSMIEYVIMYMTANMATKEDIAGLATKEQVFELQTQVNSIESELRGMNHGRLEVRVGDLEEEVFGKIRN
jgi:hypothetical protein